MLHRGLDLLDDAFEGFDLGFGKRIRMLVFQIENPKDAPAQGDRNAQLRNDFGGDLEEALRLGRLVLAIRQNDAPAALQVRPELENPLRSRALLVRISVVNASRAARAIAPAVAEGTRKPEGGSAIPLR